MTLKDALIALSGKHQLVKPQRPCAPGEKVQTACHYFTEAPILVDCEFVQKAPTLAEDLKDSKYLWVITASSVPFEKENCGGSALKHTNLTGGDVAYCGGEVWFADPSSIYLNGGSGRYPCEDDEELLESVSHFYLSIGYKIAIPPFNEDNGQRPRVFKSEAMVEWQRHGDQA